MNLTRRITLALGLLVIFTAALFPPRRHTRDSGTAPREFLFSPHLYESDIQQVSPGVYSNTVVAIDFGRFGLEATCVAALVLSFIIIAQTTIRPRASSRQIDA